MGIETERLILGEYTLDDFNVLFEIVSDPETMQHYPAPFDEQRTKVKEYSDENNGISYAYAIKREEWEKLN